MPGGNTPVISRPGSRLPWIASGVGLAAALLVGAGFALRSAPVEQPVVAAPQVVPASLFIETEPAGAAIALGAHTIRALAEDHEPGERTVQIQRNGERTNLLLTLKPAAAPTAEADAGAGKPAVVRVAVAKGKLTLSTTPWSQVFEGGRLLGETPLVELPLAAGKHTLRLKNEQRGLSKTIAVEIKAGKTTLLREKL